MVDTWRVSTPDCVAFLSTYSEELEKHTLEALLKSNLLNSTLSVMKEYLLETSPKPKQKIQFQFLSLVSAISRLCETSKKMLEILKRIKL